LLAHPGGPFWGNKDQGAWTIPKGEILPGEDALEAARREFQEETGHFPQGHTMPLGSLRQAGGKLVHVWAVEDDWDPATLVSNTFSIPWARSRRAQKYPEVDRAAWFEPRIAQSKILKSQIEFLTRLETALAE
jgi:predicted NUDIX family NTP pyrophosphohydrolase